MENHSLKKSCTETMQNSSLIYRPEVMLEHLDCSLTVQQVTLIHNISTEEKLCFCSQLFWQKDISSDTDKMDKKNSFLTNVYFNKVLEIFNSHICSFFLSTEQ